MVWSEASGRAVVIDPTDDARPIIAAVRERGLQVVQLLLTHAHVDHAADAERAMAAFGQPALLHAADLPVYAAMPHYGSTFGIHVPPLTRELGNVADNQLLTVEEGFELRVLHVPGHSPGSVAYHVAEQGWIFVGDTLFFRGVGRTDLPGGSGPQLVQSIRERLYVLPDDTTAIPGHGSATKVGDEKRLNPFVRATPT